MLQASTPPPQMLGFVDFDAAKAWKQSRLALAKFRAQCDENGEPWDQVSAGAEANLHALSSTGKQLRPQSMLQNCS